MPHCAAVELDHHARALVLCRRERQTAAHWVVLHNIYYISALPMEPRPGAPTCRPANARLMSLAELSIVRLVL